MKGKKRIHPYIPNSVPEVKARMLKEIGVENIDDLRKDLERGLQISQGCHIQIMLDSVMTTRGKPQRLKEWVALAKNLGALY